MPDLKKYWEEVRGMEQGLDDFVWLVSVHNPGKGQVGGSMMEVKRALAAKLLHAGSHRTAKDEEVEKHLTGQDAQRKKAFTDRLQRHGIAMVSIDKNTRA